MTKYKFIFDLDSTITKQEIIPLIAKQIGIYKEVANLTEKAMNGKQDFKQNFINRINMIKDIDLSSMYKILEQVKLNEYIAKFILENKQDCFIVTGNLDVIIKPILNKLNMEDRYFSCQSLVVNDKIQKITKVIDKKQIVEKFDFNFVAIGDGYNDIDMIKLANIGIAFGGSRVPPKELICSADYVFYDDKKLYKFLNNLRG